MRLLSRILQCWPRSPIFFLRATLSPRHRSLQCLESVRYPSPHFKRDNFSAPQTRRNRQIANEDGQIACLPLQQITPLAELHKRTRSYPSRPFDSSQCRTQRGSNTATLPGVISHSIKTSLSSSPRHVCRFIVRFAALSITEFSIACQTRVSKPHRWPDSALPVVTLPCPVSPSRECSKPEMVIIWLCPVQNSP